MTAAVLFQFMPPLLPSEYQRLTESIRAHGVQVPVLVDEDGAIIDGHHRDMIASELGIECPRDVRTGLTDAEKRTLAISLNKDRRHLTREQVRALIAESVKADPEMSDREHARRVGVHNETVATVRRELVAVGDVTESVTRTDSLGRQQPATKPDPREYVDPATGEVYDARSTPRPRPEPKAADRRRPLPDAFADALHELDRRADSLARLVEDDRFPANRDAVALRSLAQARKTANTLAGVLAAMQNNNSQEA